MIKIMVLTVLKKMITYNNYSLMLLSTLIALVVSPIFKKIFIRVENPGLIILVGAIGSVLYFIFAMADFITGLLASKYINELRGISSGYVKSHKLYRTFWKLTSVNLLYSMIIFLILTTEAAGFGTFSDIIFVGLFSFIFVSCGFEFHSIGENIKKSGREPLPIFNFFEKLLNVIQLRMLSEIGNKEYKEDNDEN